MKVELTRQEREALGRGLHRLDRHKWTPHVEDDEEWEHLSPFYIRDADRFLRAAVEDIVAARLAAQDTLFGGETA